LKDVKAKNHTLTGGDGCIVGREASGEGPSSKVAAQSLESDTDLDIDLGLDLLNLREN
jgi:hypothetical protein